ncbi:MAG: hypothetical protein AAFV26_02540 [Pseudomonadota bacterium]
MAIAREDLPVALPPLAARRPEYAPVMQIAVTRNGERATRKRAQRLGFWAGFLIAAALGAALYLYLSP